MSAIRALDGQLEDGRYDAFILSAETRDDGLALACTITTGSHRGDVVDLVSTQFRTRDPFDLVGLPCTLVVDGDEIRVESECGGMSASRVRERPRSLRPGSPLLAAPSGFEPPLPP